MAGLLDGIRVLDLTTMGTGPYTTQILGELGAEIIKVETPDGDAARGVGPARSPGMGTIFLNIGRGKRSIVLDLKKPEGRQVLEKLAARADVVIHNMRKSAARKLGLCYDDLKRCNETVVYCSILGFGGDGPYAGLPAYDDLIQGLVALPDLTGRASGEPRYVPLALADRTTGLFAAYAVLAAVVARLRTGIGQEVEVSMFEALAGFVLGDHLYGEVFSPPEGEMGFPRHLAPHRKPFRTSDGWIGVMPYTDRQWSALFEAVGAPELCEDDRFRSVHARTAHISELYSMVSDFLVTRSTEDWLTTFKAVDVPAMQTNTLEMLRNDPHLAAVGFFQEIDHPSEGRIWRMSPPVRWARDTSGPTREAPRLGENSREILEELGLDQEEIQALIESGATALPPAADPDKGG